MKKHPKYLALILIFGLIIFVPSCSSSNEVAEQEITNNNESISENPNDVVLLIEGADYAQLTREEFLAIPQNTYEITRTNSQGKTTSGEYTGVKWRMLAEALGVADDAVTVTLIATDGYSQAYTMDILNGEKSLFAIEKDGLPITEEAQNGQIWFCADESYTANYWTKFIAKIVVD